MMMTRIKQNGVTAYHFFMQLATESRYLGCVWQDGDKNIKRRKKWKELDTYHLGREK